MGSFAVDGQHKPKILIADDERVIADTLRAIVTQNGFDAATAYDGKAAIEKACFWHPDIFLSDVVMPRLNGIEAAILICKMIPRCRVVLFSGNSDGVGLRHEAYLLGYNFQLLQKPMHPAELVSLLHASLVD